MKNIAILGSTGSIGVNTLDVLSRMSGDFRVVAISADSNIKLLAAQARRFRPKIVGVGRVELAGAVKRLLPSGTRIVAAAEGLCAIASDPGIDTIVFAISGNACLIPLLEAIRRKKGIALANKEALVSGGELVMKLARRHGVKILPIDSEHSAVFQCIDGRPYGVSKVYLTGSGGPLLDVGVSRFDSLPPSEILKHPKWNMGKKISVDSATMMNKGLEIIEAQQLFSLDEKRIEVLIHPEAIIHSMVEFSDGAVIAQLATPDMRLPIQYALTYPRRVKAPVKRVDFAALERLTFRSPDAKKFPCLGLARQAARAGGTAPAVLCAADEEAVKCYLGGSVKFTDISKIIGKVLKRHKNTKGSLTAGSIMDADAWAREEARSLCYH